MILTGPELLLTLKALTSSFGTLGRTFSALYTYSVDDASVFLRVVVVFLHGFDDDRGFVDVRDEADDEAGGRTEDNDGEGAHAMGRTI